MTPLHWAAFHGDFKVVEKLLEYIKEDGSECKENKQGMLPVDIAGMVGSRVIK